ncbi:hypothetical protein HIM_06716 [Hirsutella minnesotensis 3608]|uniref:RPA43 OB domain-containing protein n=1 Tax=Hirsutella minnesotensis 3608 TaxID=1043627 RepID=A0A0F7ZTW5_9HYPO|nr:hypothetical protein HIM_06716 [Hirsutella minnesotensis 3608]
MATPASSDSPALKAEKKHKKDKSHKSEKKRAREEDAQADAERKLKKSKSVPADLNQEEAQSQPELKKEHKEKTKKSKEHKIKKDTLSSVDNAETPATDASPEKKKKKKRHTEGEAAVNPPTASNEPEMQKTPKKKKKSTELSALQDVGNVGSERKTKKEKKSKSTKQAPEEGAANAALQNEQQKTPPPSTDADIMDVDQAAKPSQSSSIYQPPDMPADPHFPFFAQTVSLYEPLYPVGWAQPVTNSKYQHLQHLQDKYVPSLRGVLLDYKNVAVGPVPGRDGAATDDDTPTTVVSRNEYAVGFGWITADVELFVPSRGAWMEGSVNLQTEGHIGVVCFGKFNASIEARRLPPAWKWVSNESPEAQGFEETASVITADDHGVVRQIHSTGFWVDGSGSKVKGKVRFRIRNFDAGTSGDTSYLSLEGTMLDRDSEKKLVQEEARTAQMRRLKKGEQRQRRRVPDFSMTRFAVEEKETTQGADDGAAESQTASRVQSEEAAARATSAEA